MEMDGDGRRWKEMDGDGRRWTEIDGDVRWKVEGGLKGKEPLSFHLRTSMCGRDGEERRGGRREKRAQKRAGEEEGRSRKEKAS